MTLTPDQCERLDAACAMTDSLLERLDRHERQDAAMRVGARARGDEVGDTYKGDAKAPRNSDYVGPKDPKEIDKLLSKRGKRNDADGEIESLIAKVKAIKAKATFPYHKTMASKALSKLEDAKRYSPSEQHLAAAKKYIDRLYELDDDFNK